MYANAATDEERAEAHRLMEALRRPYQYSGGAQGDEYLPWGNADQAAQEPARPTYDPARAGERPAYEADPRYQQSIDALLEKIAGAEDYDSPYAAQIRDELGKILGYGDYESPYAEDLAGLWDQIRGYAHYESPYAQQIDTVLRGILERDPFSYDLESDPAWQAYRKQYAREGRRASEDAMGQYAAMTGGMPSTAAMTAASQAGDSYNAQMTDRIPELYRLAYSMYADEGERMRNNLSALRGLDSDAYGRYGDRYERLLRDMGAAQGLDQTAYGRWGDTYDRYLRNLGVLQGLDNTEYGRWGDGFNRLLTGLDAARSIEGDRYDRYRDSVSDWRGERDFDYDRYRDELGDWRDDREYGDARADTAYERRWDEALAAAKYGDYSLLEALGVNPVLAARAGGGSGGRRTGGDGAGEGDGDGAGDYPVDMGSVEALGYGPISAEKLAELVNSGEVEQYLQNGQWRFRRAGQGAGRPSVLDAIAARNGRLLGQ